MDKPVALQDIKSRVISDSEESAYEVPIASRDEENEYTNIASLDETVAGLTTTGAKSGDIIHISKPEAKPAVLKKSFILVGVLLTMVAILSVAIGVMTYILFQGCTSNSAGRIDISTTVTVSMYSTSNADNTSSSFARASSIAFHTTSETATSSIFTSTQEASTKDISKPPETKQYSTDTSTLKSTTQTTITDNTAPSLPPRCSTGLTTAFLGVDADPCKAVADQCNNGTVNGTIPDYCECAENGIWTVIQKRFDGTDDFYCSWADYKEGFGSLKGEFWLGNELLHQLTSNANYTLKIYLTEWDGVRKYAQYDTFKIADEADGYRLTIGGYSGDAGDSMIRDNNGQMFSTKDRDNDIWDQHCAEQRYGAWWYNHCGDANLNGKYYDHINNFRADGIFWLSWNAMDWSSGYSLKETSMIIKSYP